MAVGKGFPHYPVRDDEIARVQSLHALGVLDTSVSGVMDAFTRVAADVYDAPMAAVSLVDTHRQWFKAMLGLDIREVPRTHSFCAHAIMTPARPFVVEDAARDPRFTRNPLVTGAPYLRFYAGASVEDGDGLPLGTLCVMDRRPRTPDARLLRQLQDLAAGVSAALQLEGAMRRLRRMATHDPLTGLLNRQGLWAGIETLGDGTYTLLLIDLDHLKRVNDAHGHDAGDAALRELGGRLREMAGADALVARWGGDEFVIVRPGAMEASAARALADEVGTRIRRPLVWRDAVLTVTGSIGLAEGAAGEGLAALIERADQALYAAKRAGRDSGMIAARVLSG